MALLEAERIKLLLIAFIISTARKVQKVFILNLIAVMEDYGTMATNGMEKMEHIAMVEVWN